MIMPALVLGRAGGMGAAMAPSFGVPGGGLG
jgi:hypothetical protein